MGNISEEGKKEIERLRNLYVISDDELDVYEKSKELTDQEKMSFILKKELEITEAIIKDGHKSSDTDRFAENRKKIKQYRIDLGIIKDKKFD